MCSVTFGPSLVSAVKSLVWAALWVVTTKLELVPSLVILLLIFSCCSSWLSLFTWSGPQVPPGWRGLTRLPSWAPSTWHWFWCSISTRCSCRLNGRTSGYNSAFVHISLRIQRACANFWVSSYPRQLKFSLPSARLTPPTPILLQRCKALSF